MLSRVLLWSSSQEMGKKLRFRQISSASREGRCHYLAQPALQRLWLLFYFRGVLLESVMQAFGSLI